MSSSYEQDRTIRRRLRGGRRGVALVLLALASVVVLVSILYIYPHYHRYYGFQIPFHSAMFGKDIEQPIAFSHRLHANDKEIDCRYCHSTAGRSQNAGIPSVRKCLGCHTYIIPRHEEILKLRKYAALGQPIPWTKVYYNPDHARFPHYRHIDKNVACQECHGELERVDRLRQVTFYMGFCIDCHERRRASMDCFACHY